jgi:deoxyadenosine/deoxycytidine kinase
MSLMYVEGNVGVGKSSVLDEMERRGFSVVKEPVDMWKEHLARVYHDKRWALPMHYLALTTHVETILQAARIAKNSGSVVVVERSFASVDVFAGMDSKNSQLKEYWGVHEMYRALLLKELDQVPQQTVYLRTTPSECLARVRQRARIGEDGIDIEYLKDLHDAHDAEFEQKPGVRVIDATGEFMCVVRHVIDHVQLS